MIKNGIIVKTKQTIYITKKDIVVNDLYGGKDDIRRRFENKDGALNVAKVHTIPGDPVANILGFNSGGINNNQAGSLINNILHTNISSHDGGGSPCVIGCGDKHFTPDKDYYYKSTEEDKQLPLSDFYKSRGINPALSNVNTQIKQEK